MSLLLYCRLEETVYLIYSESRTLDIPHKAIFQGDTTILFSFASFSFFPFIPEKRENARHMLKAFILSMSVIHFCR